MRKKWEKIAKKWDKMSPNLELDLLVPIVPNHAFGTKLKFLENGSSHFNADFQLFQGPSWLPKNVDKMGGLCANFSAILQTQWNFEYSGKVSTFFRRF